jgi:hypothetical protein
MKVSKAKLTNPNVALFSFWIMLALAFFIVGVGTIGTAICVAYSIVGLGIWASYRLLLKHHRAETVRRAAERGRAPLAGQDGIGSASGAMPEPLLDRQIPLVASQAAE